MIASFPSSFCSHGGRAVINAGAPTINNPTKAELAARAEEPERLGTLPAAARQVHQFWKENLRAGGFQFSARIINFPDGKPGDVGCSSPGLRAPWKRDGCNTMCNLPRVEAARGGQP